MTIIIPYGIKKFVISACNVGTVEGGGFFGFDVIAGCGNETVYFLFSMDAWINVHFKTNFFIYMYLSSGIFAFYKISSLSIKNTIDHSKGSIYVVIWWLQDTITHTVLVFLYAYCISMTIAVTYERIERIVATTVSKYFSEEIDDTLIGDLATTDINSLILGPILFIINFPRTPALLLYSMNLWEFFIKTIIFILFMISQEISTFDIVYEDSRGSIVHIGYVLSIVMDLFFLLIFRWYDRILVLKSEILSPSDIEEFYYYIMIFYSIVWASNYGLTFYPYGAILLSTIIYVILMIIFIGLNDRTPSVFFYTNLKQKKLSII